MSTHRRHLAGRAEQRFSTFRHRPTIVVALILSLLAAACGSAQTANPAGTTPPVPQEVDDAASETVGALEAIGTPGDDDVPDYTAAELEVLLEGPATDEGVVDPPEPEPLEADSPAAAIEAIEAELDDSTGAAGSARPILDNVQPLDDAPTGAVFGIRDGRHINEAGEAIRLDQAAALACANVEIALTALDEGRSAEAADRVRAASVLAADTALPVMKSWAPVLDQTAGDVTAGDMSNRTPSTGTASALLAFLSTCTQGGYEL